MIQQGRLTVTARAVLVFIDESKTKKPVPQALRERVEKDLEAGS